MLRGQSLNCRKSYDGFIKAALGFRPIQARCETSLPVLDRHSTRTRTWQPPRCPCTSSTATMAATFRTRPWLLASSRPVALPSYFSGPRVHRANLEQTRGRAYKRDAAYRQGVGSAQKQQSKQQATSSIIKEMHGPGKVQDTGSIAMLSPRKNPLTIVVRGWFSYA